MSARSRTGEAGLDPSVACVRVCAERRRHGHGGDTKLMVCTRQGNRERGTARNGPTALVGDIRRQTTSRARECACTGSARKNRVSARWWCVQANHRRRSHGDGTSPTTCARQGTETGGRRAGKCARRGSVLTRLLAKERQGLGSTLRAQPCGCRRQTEARRRTSNKGTTQLQGNRARTAMTAVAPAKRPAQLDGRLSSDGGSAQRREQAAGNTPTTSSQGSYATAARRPGAIAREGIGAHLALLQAVVRWRMEIRRGSGSERR
jgi:hypothetical protein